MASVSFKISKQIRSKIVPPSSDKQSAIKFSSKNDDDDGEMTNLDEDNPSKKSILALDREKGFQDVKKDEQEKAIVIPPLQNTLNLLGKSANDEYQTAKMALLDDVRKYKEGGIEVDSKHKVPVVEKIDFKQTTLPESASEADYDDIPVESFGKALLRGMGWSEGQPIGRSSSKVVKPWITEPRPRGLGLGAESQKPKSSDEDQKSIIKKGSFVKLTKNGQYGLVVGVDNEGGRLFVKLRDDEKQILNLAQFAVQIIEKSEYEGKNRNGDDLVSEKDKNRNHDLSRKTEKVKSRDGDHDVSKTLKSSWLFADLKVRLIDRKSKYFKEKMIILDVQTPETCNCRIISNEKILDDLHFSKLETVVPRDKGAEVKILRGRHKGKVGKLIERDSKKSEATIRFLDDGAEKVLNFSFDDICEFVGHTND